MYETNWVKYALDCKVIVSIKCRKCQKRVIIIPVCSQVCAATRCTRPGCPEDEDGARMFFVSCSSSGISPLPYCIVMSGDIRSWTWWGGADVM